MVSRQSVSLLLVAYDRAPLLKSTLESVLFQDRKPEQIVVVEDGNDGGKTEAVCTKFAARGLPIEYVCRRNRPDVPYSNSAIPKNIGIRKCTGDIIIIQCAEVRYTKPTDTSLLVGPVEDDLTVSMFAPCVALDWNGAFKTWYGDPQFRAFLGFCHAVRRDRVVAIGGFDENFIGYGREDDDFSWRLHVSGITYKWADGVLVEHQCHDVKPSPDDTENDRRNAAYGGEVIDAYYKHKTRGLESNVGKNWGDPNS